MSLMCPPPVNGVHSMTLSITSAAMDKNAARRDLVDQVRNWLIEEEELFPWLLDQDDTDG